MNPLLRLDNMLSDYRSLFKYNNFDHFCSFIKGLINTVHRGTMTQIYLSSEQSKTYWTLPKFLSRSKWSVDELTSLLTRQVQNVLSKGVYVYDETHSTNNGLYQFGTHYFKNTRYNTRNKDAGDPRSMGAVCISPTFHLIGYRNYNFFAKNYLFFYQHILLPKTLHTRDDVMRSTIKMNVLRLNNTKC